MAADTTVLVLIAGALVGGFVSGVVGFGAGPVVLAFWLLVLDPVVAVPVLTLSAIAHIVMNLRLVWHDMSPRRLAPLAVGGLAGLPVGTALLLWLSPAAVRLAVGLALVGYAGLRLAIARDVVLPVRGPWPDVGAGVVVGIATGLAGIPGPIATLWCGLRGWTKTEQRAVFTPLNALMVAGGIVAVWVGGLVTREVLVYAAWAMPAMILGVAAGTPLYRRLSDRQFQSLVLLLLGAMGAMLVAGNLR